MKVLLIQPPVRDFYQTKIRTQPIGLAYLASSLQQKKHRVEILDCQVPGKKQQVPAPDSFSYMKQFYSYGDMSPFRLYSGYFHFGLTYMEIHEHIKNSSPQVAGIACQFTPYLEEAFRIASLVKSIDSNIPVIFGGAHASSLPEKILKNPHVDYVIIGEGEETLPLLIQSIESADVPREIEGIGFKVKGSIHINQKKSFISDLDSLPFPARNLLNPSFYKINGMAYTMLLTSRGCPQNCSYCSVGNVMGKKFRVRSPENIIKEIRHCRTAYGITFFDIEDDNFTLDPQRTLRALDLIIDEFGEDEIKLFAMNGLSIISLNREILQKMKKAGFQYLDLSLGSTSVEANRKMDRLADPKKAETVLKQANELGFPITTYIILGVPGHSLKEMMDSILYLMGRETFLGPSIFYPSPGTRMYEGLYKDGSLPEFSLLRSSLFPVQTDEFSRSYIITLLRLVRWINFIKRILPFREVSEICLEDLRQEAVSKWWPEHVPNNVTDLPGNMLYMSSLEPLKTDDTGKILTALFLYWKNFYGIKRIRVHNKELYTYQIFPYKTSSRVINLFLDKKDRLFIRAAIRKKALK